MPTSVSSRLERASHLGREPVEARGHGDVIAQRASRPGTDGKRTPVKRHLGRARLIGHRFFGGLDHERTENRAPVAVFEIQSQRKSPDLIVETRFFKERRGVRAMTRNDRRRFANPAATYRPTPSAFRVEIERGRVRLRSQARESTGSRCPKNSGEALIDCVPTERDGKAVQQKPDPSSGYRSASLFLYVTGDASRSPTVERADRIQELSSSREWRLAVAANIHRVSRRRLELRQRLETLGAR